MMENVIGLIKKADKRKTECRMTNLLSKIRKKKPSGDGTENKKLKKVHLKWKRFDVNRNAFYLVPHKSGGGYRFGK